MTKYYDPDPLGMGLVATLECVICGRDRYAEVTSTKDDDVIRLGEGIVELPGVRCPCGETKICTGWLSGDGNDMSEYCFDEPLPTQRQSASTSQTRRSYSGTPTPPLPQPLAHGVDEPLPTQRQSASTSQTKDGYGDTPAPPLPHSFDEPLPIPPQSASSSQTRDGYWDTPTPPLPQPLAHQFRQSAGGQQCEADFRKMTLAMLRLGELLMSEEPVLYDLMCGLDGRLRMRPNEESRKIMIANIQERLTDHEHPRDAAASQRDMAKLAALHRGDWSPIPPSFVEPLQERYQDFLRTTDPRRRPR